MKNKGKERQPRQHGIELKPTTPVKELTKSKLRELDPSDFESQSSYIRNHNRKVRYQSINDQPSN